jgi:hypothetical protein
MSPSRIAFSAAVAGCLGAWLLQPLAEEHRLAADPAALRDSDGDLLADDLEWVLLSDPSKCDTDDDGVDDFLAAAQHLTPGGQAVADDHEMRIAVSCRPDASGRDAVWLNVLLRFVGGSFAVDYFEPYLDYWGYGVPLTQLLGNTQSYVKLRNSTRCGLYALFSVRLGSVDEFRRFLPCTIGARAILGGRFVASGILVQRTTDVITVMAPVGGADVVCQTLSPGDGGNPFWTSGRVCWMTLAVIASTGYGHLCEVARAQCERSGTLRCPPNCQTATGGMMFVPDGIQTITGGGRP